MPRYSRCSIFARTWPTESANRNRMQNPSAKSIIHRVNCRRRFFYRNRWTESGSFIGACSTSPSTIGSPRSSNLIVFFLFESSSESQALKINEKRTLPTFELVERVRLASSSCQFRFTDSLSFHHTFRANATVSPNHYPCRLVSHSRSFRSQPINLARNSCSIATSKRVHRTMSRSSTRDRMRKRKQRNVHGSRTFGKRAENVMVKSIFGLRRHRNLAREAQRTSQGARRNWAPRTNPRLSLFLSLSLYRARALSLLTLSLSLSLSLSPSVDHFYALPVSRKLSPSESRCLCSFHPSEIQFSFSIVSFNPVPPPPFLSVFSFLPFFFCPFVSSLLSASPFFYPLNVPRSSPLYHPRLTPVGPCRSKPLREHIFPWPPYQCLLTWSFDQYCLSSSSPSDFSRCSSFPACHLHYLSLPSLLSLRSFLCL